ncbi:hypothetical protein F6V30_10690 [Oryzomonas sagensis]|uniref:Uncharacterized protein n=1 Tax=Oryzomonas sagensis TaxID=2603857 RepID=A0ABQ6TPN2_9BACT|nr:hypothetical protein [Oryzomonas sagensis]KAB0670594.1 hypothetical protein F6V30_10690 [Oryzomonas sagensis]
MTSVIGPGKPGSPSVAPALDEKMRTKRSSLSPAPQSEIDQIFKEAREQMSEEYEPEAKGDKP